MVPAPVILHQRADQIEIGGLRLALVDPERRRELRQVGRLLLALLPARQRARGQRADHLRDVEPLDRAVLEHRRTPCPSRFDMIARWLVPEERTLIFACILPSSLSKSARLRSSGSARTPVRSARSAKVGLAVGGIDGQIAIGVAVIGAEIGDLRLQHAARQRGVDRGGRETRRRRC